MHALRGLTTVHKGTLFEQRSLGILHDLSMLLTRVGGASDGGVDLVGWWWLPGRREIRVLGQCKAEKKKFGPGYVREMEGVVGRYPTSTLVALLVSSSPFTKATMVRAQGSNVPFFLLHLPEEASEGDDGIGTAWWNSALGGTNGVLGGKGEVRWEWVRTTEGKWRGRPVLWMDGERVERCVSS